MIKKLLEIHTDYAILKCHLSMHNAPHLLSQVPLLIEHGGYGLLAASVVVEALPFIGSLIPGHVIIITAGFFAKLGVLQLQTVLLISIISAIIGDVIGFLAGRRWGESFLKKFSKRLFLKEEYIERTKQLIDQHTGKTIILGKFSPITRPYIPFLVGASRVSTPTFWLYNIIGSVLWAGISVLLGYLFGASYPVFAHYFGKFIFIAIIVSILIIWGYKFINARFQVFKKYELFMLGLNVASLWIFFKTIQDTVARTSFFTNFDIYINLFVHEHAMQWMIAASSFIGSVGTTGAFFILGLVLGFALLMKERWRRAGIVLMSVTSSAVIVQWAKVFFMRERPVNALELVAGGSFPSGHACLAAAFFMACIYIFTPKIKSWVLRELFIVACVLCIVAVGLSRLVLNVHWASDIIAGWSLGIFLATGSVLFVRYAAVVLLRDTK
jgi:membrane protein DedA with SNARE-associated domain